MVKKLVILFSILAVIFSFSVTVAYASEIVASGECGENAKWELDSDGVLTVSGTGSMNTSYQSGYGQVKTPWADYTVKKVVINEGITSVQDSAFADNKALESVILPETVYDIGDSVFSGCENLKEVKFPKKIVNPQIQYIGALGMYEEVRPTIGPYAFAFCASLENITIPDGFERIHFGAFEYCTSLENVTLSDDINVIYDGAFKGCLKLKNINIPKGVSTIQNFAFEGCSELEEIKLPENLERINSGAFLGCSKLEKINIPKTVSYVGAGAFDGTKWYENQPDGVIYINNVLHDYKGEMPENTKIVIPNNITILLPDALKGQENLKSIVIGEGIKRIENNSFEGCTNLESINMSDYVTSIGEYAFKYCTSLKNVELSENITEIGNGAFSNCKSLEKIVLPKNMNYIGRLTFEYCENLKEVKLPTNYTPFKEIYGSLGYPAGSVLPMGIFKGCTSLEKITIPDGIERIDITAFLDCVNLKEITLPASVTYLEDCFYNCHNITDVYYGGSEKTWDNVKISVSNTSFTDAKIHYENKYYSDTTGIGNKNNITTSKSNKTVVKINDENNIVIDVGDKLIGKNMLCVFVKDNEFLKVNKAVLEKGTAEFKIDDEYDEVRIYVYDKPTSPKFDFYEKIKL